MTLSTCLSLLCKHEKTLKLHRVSDGTPNDGQGLWPLALSLHMSVKSVAPYYSASWSPSKHASSEYYPQFKFRNSNQGGFHPVAGRTLCCQDVLAGLCPGLGLITSPMFTKNDTRDLQSEAESRFAI
jgi:hypothetical protein